MLAGSANPHAAEQVVPADELMIEGCAGVQEDEEGQERPARPVDHPPGVARAVESLRDAADAPQFRKIAALNGHDQP